MVNMIFLTVILTIIWFALLPIILKAAFISRKLYKYLYCNSNELLKTLTLFGDDDINLINSFKIVKWVFNDEKYEDGEIRKLKAKLSDLYTIIFFLGGLFILILAIAFVIYF